jgi:carbamoyltransferase
MTEPQTPNGSHWLVALHEDSNANATLFKDGLPIYAVAEGRLSRVKYAAGFPAMALQACLDYGGLDIGDLDVIVPANRHHFLPRVTGSLLPEGEHDYFGPKHKAWLYFQHALSRGGLLASLTEGISRRALRRRFPQLGEFVDHHTAHAFSAYLTSGFDECLAVTSDNMGDGFSSKVFACRSGRCEELYGSSARHSPGQFYGEIAQLLGFHNLNAGKVTGLAAHGNPSAAYETMCELFSLNAEKTGFVSPDLFWRSKKRGPYATLKALPIEDVAAAAQKRLEDVMVEYVQHAVRETGLSRVVLAGGTFANVVVNQKILHLPEVESIYIHPAMTDQGISMGAGLAWLSEAGLATNQPLDTIYLGPGYSEEEMGSALEESGLRYERPKDLADTAAKALVDRKVVARYDGRLEYGPRALGNRSILFRTDDPSVNNWLNQRLNRTEFMPFAPVTLAEHVDDCYVGTEGGRFAARYMTITFEVQEQVKKRSPGVVHLDGTARPQILHENDNPGYYAILRRYYELTGTPTLINTSFNMHGEPIVCSPDDAIRAFKASGLDRLILGPFFVFGSTEEESGADS